MAELIDKASSSDFYALDKKFYDLKYQTGMAQMVVGGILYFVNKYFIDEQIIFLASVGLFSMGFILVGVKFQTIVSPTRKLIKKIRGFYFLQFNKYYSSSEIDHVRVIDKTRRGTDQNGIGPTRTNTLITTFHCELILKDGTIADIHSDKKRGDMEKFTEKVAEAMGVRFLNDISW